MTSRHAGFFTAVLAFHVLALWTLQSGLALKVMDRLPQASLVVQLLAPQIQPPVPLPVAEIPPPPPVMQPRPRKPLPLPPKPLEHAITEPEPPTAPVETALEEPVPVEQPPEVTVPDLAVTAAPVTPPPEPIDPPRFDAAYLNNPTPVYPPLSLRLGEKGRVLLRVYVLSDGSPAQIEIRKSSGYSRLDQAALAAVRKWKFISAMRGTEKVAEWVVFPISFGD